MAKPRPCEPADAPLLLDPFRDTVRPVNSRDYTPDQIRAWASDDIDPRACAAQFTGRFVVLASQWVQCRGAEFLDCRMERILDGPGDSAPPDVSLGPKHAGGTAGRSYGSVAGSALGATSLCGSEAPGLRMLPSRAKNGVAG